MFALLVIILIDTSLVKVYDLVEKYYLPTEGKLILFCALSFACVLLQCVIIRYLKSIKKDYSKKKLAVRIFDLIPLASLYAIGAVFAVLAFQQFYYNHYNKILSILVITISYGTASILIIRLSTLFISWYISQKNIIILLYFLSMSLIAFSLITTAFITSLKINERPHEIREFIGGSANIYVGKFIILDTVYTASSFMSFISLWVTTAILMNYYRDKLVNAIGYWVMISIPLIYFLVNYFYTTIFGNLLVSSRTLDPVGISIVLTTFLTLSKPVGGLTFGVAFWKISRSIRYEKNISTYMVTCGWGMLLIFGANQATAQVLYPYPPFGLATITVMITAAFLMLLGIYNSAVLVSASTDLRKDIHKHALQSKLLGLIGRAEVEKEVQKTINEIIRDRDMKISEEDTKPRLELDAAELSKYLELVARELKKDKDQNN
ncbi:hypothetical protein BH18THE2_BH18THE2_24630 [soil metagenome]